MNQPQFREEAEADVQEAMAWYEEKRRGLGAEFLLCLEATMERIARHPTSSRAVLGEVRRALLRRFPYSVIYVLEGETVLVLAVLHGSRNPDDLRKRLDG